MTEKKEYEIALKVCELISTNDNIDDFITALNESPPEVKAWLIKVLPHEEEQRPTPKQRLAMTQLLLKETK
jgi:glycine cleavage system H lipoate-binding protein